MSTFNAKFKYYFYYEKELLVIHGINFLFGVNATEKVM